MKPHIYKYHGRWTYTTYGKAKSKAASLKEAYANNCAAHAFCVRMNRKLGLTP